MTSFNNLESLVQELEAWPSYGHDIELSFNGDTLLWEASVHFVPHSNYSATSSNLRTAIEKLIDKLPNVDEYPSDDKE